MPATGVAALVLTVTLAGCGSASKTASSNSVAGSGESSASSAAASSAPAAATQPGPPGSPTVTLPELPGWSGDSATLKDDPSILAAVHYDETPDEAFIAVSMVAVDGPDQAIPAASAGANKLNNVDNCAFEGAIDETSISGFQGFQATQICTPSTTTRVSETRAIAVPNTSGTSYVVVITGTAKQDQMGALDDAMKLVDSETTITPAQ
ncbi:MAG: LpqN/LpqT family lipoprotein [Mycobacterium sp.]